MNLRPLVQLACLVVTGSFTMPVVAVECEPLTTESSHYDLVVGATRELFPYPPARVAYCGALTLHLWQVSWEAYETWGSWRKSGSASCWAKPRPEPLEIWSCSRSIRADRADGVSIRLTHEIRLGVVDEIVTAVTGAIPPNDRVISVNYTAVAGGGTWSTFRDGYQVSTSRSPYHGSGEIFTVVRDCAPSPCQWQVLSSGARWVN